MDSANLRLIGVSLVMLVVGAASLGVTLLVMGTITFPPAKHRAIVETINVSTEGHTLTCSYLYSKRATWKLEVQPFVWQGTYQYSVWVYSYEDDPEVFLTIWGPGEDGATYYIELASSGVRLNTVQWPGNEETFQNWIDFTVTSPFTLD